MAFRDTLQSLKTELDETRVERRRQSLEEETRRQAQREELSQLAESLAIPALVSEMNRVLLEDSGKVVSYSSWDSPPESAVSSLAVLPLGEDDDEDDDADYISAELTWEEDGEREIAVDLGIAEEGFYLQVNGIDVRIEREALEQALVEAFREELQV
jgi:hypothetical protein